LKKLTFIVENFFVKRDFDRFDLQYYLDNNVEVEVWDITEFSNRNFNKLVVPKDIIKQDYVKKFKSSEELKDSFKSLKSNGLVAVHVSLNIRTILIFQLLSKYKINYFTKSGASLKVDPKYGKFSFYRKIINFLERDKKSNIEFFQNLCLRFLPLNFLKISDLPIYFKQAKIADKKTDLRKKLLSKKTKIILSHHRDYDLYLKYKNTDNKKDQSGSVFIDQNTGFHNDLIKIGEFMDPKEWYDSLTNFFKYLEKKYLVKTTICAHPRSNGEINNFVKDYPIIKNKTVELVKNSSFVICQASTAINFAALYKKPMIFVYNHVAMKDKKSKINHAGEVEFYAKAFNKKPININYLNDFDLDKELKIDEEYYDKYISEYLKSWGPKKKISEMTMDLL